MAEESEYIDRNDIIIENSVATWNIKAEGPILGTYMGTFKFRCYLLPSQLVEAGRDRRDMLGNNAILANDDDKFYAYALSQLKHRVISGPPFWESSRDINGFAGDIPDIEVLAQVLSAAVDSEAKYKYELEKRKKDAVERAKKAAEAMIKQRDSDESQTEKNSDQS